MTLKHRFSALLSDGEGRPPHDRPLLETADWIIAPSLGSIVPNWLLAIPRKRALNYAVWHSLTQIDPIVVVDDLCDRLSIGKDRVVWFEHGAAEGGSEIGCGVDYAHLHVLVAPPFSFEAFAQAAQCAHQLAWTRLLPEEVYKSLSDGASYLVMGSGRSAYLSQNTQFAGSQFFRRVIGNLAGQPDGWDYRSHPHQHNIAQTIRQFPALIGATEGG